MVLDTSAVVAVLFDEPERREFIRQGPTSRRTDFGDLFAYALARASGEELLFKGDDFTQTDIVAA